MTELTEDQKKTPLHFKFGTYIPFELHYPYTQYGLYLASKYIYIYFFLNMDRTLPGSSVYGILQARILEWVAISFSRGSIFPTQGSKPTSLMSPAPTGGFFTISATWEAPRYAYTHVTIMITFNLTTFWRNLKQGLEGARGGPGPQASRTVASVHSAPAFYMPTGLS